MRFTLFEWILGQSDHIYAKFDAFTFFEGIFGSIWPYLREFDVFYPI